MDNRYYCNFQRLEDKSSISVGFQTEEASINYAEEIVGCPVINIRVTENPLYETVVEK